MIIKIETNPSLDDLIRRVACVEGVSIGTWMQQKIEEAARNSEKEAVYGLWLIGEVHF